MFALKTQLKQHKIMSWYLENLRPNLKYIDLIWHLANKDTNRHY
jgi:hypothetical protein